MTSKKINIDANTELYCIFGKPVRHSLSPAMQNAAFKSAGMNAVYLAFEVGNIKEGIFAMRALGIKGASITIPFKQDAMNYLDETDPLAEEIGSVNTLKNENGVITGYNTDGYGAVNALKNNGVDIKNSRVLIIGNGGSARAITFTILQAGASATIAGRNTDRILNLVNDIRAKGREINHILIKDISPSFIKEIDIIINTTPIGMAPNIDEAPIEDGLILGSHIVFDIVYSPDMTKLLKIAKSKKCKTVKGIEMLVNQGAKQFEIWTGNKAPVSIMQKSIGEDII